MQEILPEDFLTSEAFFCTIMNKECKVSQISEIWGMLLDEL